MRFRFSKAALGAAFLFLFLVANRGAHEGYFSDDDLDNLASTLLAGFDAFWRGFVSPLYDRYNFRPVGHVTYRWLGQLWGLWFPPYIAVMQFLHLTNALLVYRLVRTVLTPRAAMSAAVFFAFHSALLSAHWKPMYLFDVLCGMALISAFSLYRSGRWGVALLLFWCAYKSKEIAIFFPLVLLLEEWQDQRRWLRVAPFLAVSLVFGSQALMQNEVRLPSAYTLQFTMAAFTDCLRFYGGMAAGLPWILLAGWRWLGGTERRWLVMGIIAATALLGPLLFLPGRLFSVYLYVPLMFGAVAVGAVVNRWPSWALTLAFLIYAGIGLRELRIYRRAELTQAQTTKEFVSSACLVLKDRSSLAQAFYEAGPQGLNVWGVEATYRLCSGNLMLKLSPWDLKQLRPNDPVIRWTKMPNQAGLVELTRFDGELVGGWYGWDSSFRWMGERAEIRVKALPGHRHVLLDLVSIPADELEVLQDGNSIGKRTVQDHGPQKMIFPLLHSDLTRDLRIELRAWPAKRIGNDPRMLSVAVRSVKPTP